MPKKAHRALAKAARRKGLTGADFNRYVYGKLNKIEKKAKKRKK